MGPTDVTCGECGYTFPGATPDTSKTGGQDEGPRQRVADGPRSGIKIRRDAAPFRRPDREADDAKRARTTAPTAGGDSLPAGSLKQAHVQPPPTAEPGGPDPPEQPLDAGGPTPGGGRYQRRPFVQATTGSSMMATLAMVGGLLGCVPLFSPAALVLGILGLREIRRSTGFMAGWGRAVFGIVAGALGTLAWVGLAALAVAGGGAGLQAMQNVAGQFFLVANMAVMEQLPTLQDTLRSQAVIDADGDGKGEYGTSEQLGANFDDLDLQPLESGDLGWVLRIELPRATNLREQQWWAFMEPVSEDKPWLYIDESHILRSSADVTGTPTRRQAKRWEATSVNVLVEQMLAE